MDEREFTEAQLRWAWFMGRAGALVPESPRTYVPEDKVVALARTGCGMTWLGNDEEEDDG